MVLKTGIWIEKGLLECPYCNRPFRPRKIHDIKQCPNCHRYFIVDRIIVGGENIK